MLNKDVIYVQLENIFLDNYAIHADGGLVVSAADYKPEVVGSNPTRGMAVYLCLSYCVIVLRRGL